MAGMTWVESASRSEGLDFSVANAERGIHFWNRLAHAGVFVQCPVILGMPGRRFSLGPAVAITCESLSVPAESVEVDGTEYVELAARAYDASTFPRLTMRGAKQPELRVDWPDVAHPWAPYRATLQDPSVVPDTPRFAVLYKFVLMFRRQRSRLQRTVSNARWAPHEIALRDELILLALRHKVIEPAGQGDDKVFLYNTTFDSLKALVGSRRRTGMTPEVRAFVNAFLGE